MFCLQTDQYMTIIKRVFIEIIKNIKNIHKYLQCYEHLIV